MNDFLLLLFAEKKVGKLEVWKLEVWMLEGRKRFNKKQKYEVVNNLERLAANALSTWKNFPTDVLTKAWAPRQTCSRP